MTNLIIALTLAILGTIVYFACLWWARLLEKGDRP